MKILNACTAMKENCTAKRRGSMKKFLYRAQNLFPYSCNYIFLDRKRRVSSFHRKWKLRVLKEKLRHLHMENVGSILIVVLDFMHMTVYMTTMRLMTLKTGILMYMCTRDFLFLFHNKCVAISATLTAKNVYCKEMEKGCLNSIQ